MHIFVKERGMFLHKHSGGSGMGDRACKTSFFGVLVRRRTSSFSPEWHVGLLVCKWNHVALFCMLLSQYMVMGALTEGWKMLGEYTPTIKSSETQFCKPFLASKILPKLMKLVTEGYNFSLRLFWQVVELKRSSYDQIMTIVRIQLNWISPSGEHRESSFQGKLIARASHLSPLGITYYFACIWI